VPNARSHAERVSEGTIPGGGMWQTWRVFHQELVREDAVVDSVVSAYQNGYPQAEYHKFGIWIRADSVTSTPDFFVDVIQSWDDKAENYGGDAFGGGVGDNLIHLCELNIPPMPWMRIRLRGQSGNPADTLVDIYLFMQT